jgi:hypothetical protein
MAGFIFDGSDDYVTLADNAGYDVSANGDSIAWSLWFNPDDARTTPEVLLDRDAWFTVYLLPDDTVQIKFGDGTVRTTRNKVVNGSKNHLMFALKNDSAVATGTADTNVASLLIDLDANWWTNGINLTNNQDGRYLVYNRTDRTYDYGTVIADVTFTASTATVSADNDTIDLTSHSYIDGTPCIITGADVPAGLTSGNQYYIGDATGGLIYLYDTAAHAVTNDGSTGLIDLTDAGSGTVTIAVKEDAILLDSDLCPDGNEVVMVFADPWQAELRVWLNGIRQNSINETLFHFNTPADSANVINVGQYNDGSLFFDGYIAHVAVWTPGWPTDEIAAAVYNNGTELTYATTITADGAMTALGYWAFDDDAASTAVDNDEGTAGLDGTSSNNTEDIVQANINKTSYYESDRVIALTAATTLSNGPYIVDHMEWDGSATADDDLLVEEASGSTIWEVNNKVANDRAVFYPEVGYYRQIKLTTIDAGTLYIHLK